MATISLSARPGGARPAGEGGAGRRDALRLGRPDPSGETCAFRALRAAARREASIAAKAGRRPLIVLMVHGFLYEPNATPGSKLDARRNPHRRLLAPTAAQSVCSGMRTWPEVLGFAGAVSSAGLAVAFGWSSMPGPIGRRDGRPGYGAAYAAAGPAAIALGEAAAAITEGAPEATIDLYAHSLGGRVALLTLRRAAEEGWADRFGRVLLLGCAEYRDRALRAARQIDAAGERGAPQVVNFISRANDPFDAMWQLCGPRTTTAALAAPLGASGLGRRRAHWIDVQIDHPRTDAWLAEHGVGPSRRRRACHWSFYARPGLARFHRRILEERWSVAELRARGAPECVEPRWARLSPFGSAPVRAVGARAGRALAKA